MRIDVWSDLVCPFCHLGRRHLALALEEFEHADECEVIWHSFELDRTAPPVREGSTVDHVAAKYGVPREQMEATHRAMAEQAAAVGLDFRWDRLVSGNSFDAHRVLHLARERGVEGPVMDAVMHGWYTDGRALGDRATLVELAAQGGLDPAEVADMLDSDDFGPQVRTDEALAAQIGITAVPTFVLDQKLGVQGAQPVPVLLDALREAWAQRGVAPTPREEASCAGACGSCGCGS